VPGGVPYGLNEGILTPDESRWEGRARRLRRPADLRAEGDPIAEKGEIYLELARVDEADETQILSFCERFRALAVRDRDFAAFASFPDFEEAVRPGLEAAWAPELLPFGTRLEEGIEDFRFGARCVRDMVRAHTILRGSDDGAPWESLQAGSSWISREDRAVYEEHEVEPSREDEAAAGLTRLVTPGLAPLQPQLVDGPMDQFEAEFALLVIPLYSICCLELYNHVVENSSYAECANETCGKVFVRQHGRAVHGQNRAHGVMYCSLSCARAQNQRNHRRKKADRRTQNSKKAEQSA
jgi:hypothetical protein